MRVDRHHVEFSCDHCGRIAMVPCDAGVATDTAQRLPVGWLAVFERRQPQAVVMTIEMHVCGNPCLLEWAQWRIDYGKQDAVLLREDEEVKA